MRFAFRELCGCGPDKTAEEADTIERVREIYEQQN
jgi:hypothetical protein